MLSMHILQIQQDIIDLGVLFYVVHTYFINSAKYNRLGELFHAGHAHCINSAKLDRCGGTILCCTYSTNSANFNGFGSAILSCLCIFCMLSQKWERYVILSIHILRIQQISKDWRALFYVVHTYSSNSHGFNRLGNAILCCPCIFYEFSKI